MDQKDSADTAEQQAGGFDALDQIAAEGAALQQIDSSPAAKAQEAAQVAELETNAGQLLFALESARMMAAPLFGWWPDFGQTWNDRQLGAIAEAGAAVMQRHGWSMADMERFGPYIALGLATVPPGFATYQAIKLQREQLQAEQRRGTPQ